MKTQTDKNAAVLEALSAFPLIPPGELRARLGLLNQSVYEADTDVAGGIVRISPDGTRTAGRLVDGKFVASALNRPLKLQT